MTPTKDIYKGHIYENVVIVLVTWQIMPVKNDQKLVVNQILKYVCTHMDVASELMSLQIKIPRIRWPWWYHNFRFLKVHDILQLAWNFAQIILQVHRKSWMAVNRTILLETSDKDTGFLLSNRFLQLTFLNTWLPVSHDILHKLSACNTSKCQLPKNDLNATNHYI